MEIRIDSKNKKIIIEYDVTEESKKILSHAQNLVNSLPHYALKILPFAKSKKDKESQP